MAKRKWAVRTPNEHEILMEHDWISGRAVVRVDGNESCRRERKIFDTGLRHEFELDGRVCRVEIRGWSLQSLLFRFVYRLTVDGNKIDPSEAIDDFRPSKWGLLLLIPFVALAGLIIYATAIWKIPCTSAENYWELRLAGAPHAFIRSDGRWVYHASQGFHGWLLAKTSIQEIAQTRDDAVRRHIEGLLVSKEWPDSARKLHVLTGLALDSRQAWENWWAVNKDSYSWPCEREKLWTDTIVAGFNSSGNELREYYASEVVWVWPKAILEILFFGSLLYLIWPFAPCLYYVARVTFGRKHPLLTGVALCVVLALGYYVFLVAPNAFLSYGAGACTTYDGPGAFSSSGPYPFYLQYKPGNTIIYRQFLELIYDPLVRLGRTGLLNWLPEGPIWGYAMLPYLAIAPFLGLIVGWSIRRGNRRAVIAEAKPSVTGADVPNP